MLPRLCSLDSRMRHLARGENLKIGIRKPSLKSRISARTSIKRQVIHRTGLKMPRGSGWLRNPKKSVYNKVYQKTSFDFFGLLKKLFK